MQLNDLIQRIEETNAKGRMATNAQEINPILEELGGKPIAVNESCPGAGDGSLLHELHMYMVLLVCRRAPKGGGAEG